MNKPLQKTISPNMEKNNELNIIELWEILVRYKLLIVIVTVITTLGSIYYLSNISTTYKAEVLLFSDSGERSGGGGIKISGVVSNIAGINIGGNKLGSSQSKAIALLKTRSFLSKYIKDENIKPILFADNWNKKGKFWINKEEPSDRDASELLMSMIKVSYDTKYDAGIVKVILEWENPYYPDKIAKIANSLIASINNYTRIKEIKKAKNKISFLKKELEVTSVVKLQQTLYNLIELEISNIALINASDEYIFSIIDPAVNPKHPEYKPIFMIIFIGFILGLFLGFLLSIFIDNVKKQKAMKG